MNRQEWIATLQNVASDLLAISETLQREADDEIESHITDAKLACEYVTHEQPHL